MWAVVVVLYAVPGLMTSGLILGLFPPHPGYQPPWYWSVCATLICVLFWPLLAVLALGYLIGHWSRLRSDHQRDEANRQTITPARFQYQKLYKETPN